MPVTNLKTSLENKAFFVRLSKIGTARHSREQQFAKLSTSRQQELEELYKGHSPRYSKVAKTDKMANLLVQILQVQEVQTIKEYTLNGYTFKVHVLRHGVVKVAAIVVPRDLCSKTFVGIRKTCVEVL